MRDTIDMAREAGAHPSHNPELWDIWEVSNEALNRLVALVRADERMSFYGQDKPVECAEGCPPSQICDYCQVVAPAKAMILAEREACAKVCDEVDKESQSQWPKRLATMIRARGNT